MKLPNAKSRLLKKLKIQSESKERKTPEKRTRSEKKSIKILGFGYKKRDGK